MSAPTLKRKLIKGHRKGFSTILADSERKMTRNIASTIRSAGKDVDAFHLTRVKHGSVPHDRMNRVNTMTFDKSVDSKVDHVVVKNLNE